MKRWLSVAAACFSIGAAACGIDGAGDGDETEETQDVAAPLFSELNRDVLAKRCTFACHSGGEFAAAGLDMSGDTHSALLQGPPIDPTCAALGLARIVPGKPDESLLYLKIVAKTRGSQPPCGESMPSGANKAALSEDEVAAVRAWIEAGARDD
jgi:hypothetical protein